MMVKGMTSRRREVHEANKRPVRFVQYAIITGCARVRIPASLRGTALWAQIRVNTLGTERTQRTSFLLERMFSTRPACNRDKNLSGLHASFPTAVQDFNTESRGSWKVSSVSRRSLRSRQLDRTLRSERPVLVQLKADLRYERPSSLYVVLPRGCECVLQHAKLLSSRMGYER
jgi:hypothetical protein